MVPDASQHMYLVSTSSARRILSDHTWLISIVTYDNSIMISIVQNQTETKIIQAKSEKELFEKN